MALIPYEHLPPPHDPALAVGNQPLQEYYCGDAQCDCATAHVVFAGAAFTVDLGTLRVDPVDQRQNSAQYQALAQALRSMLGQGAISTLRSHYAAVRKYGLQQHFRYVDWSGLKSGDLVSWDHVFRQESVPMWTMKAEAEQTTFLLGLRDAYCIEPRCDCRRVVWSVLTAPAAEPSRSQTLGTVELSFASRMPSVVRHAQAVEPNQLFMLVHNLLRGQPQLFAMYEERYSLLRTHLTPILAAQRRQRSTAQRQSVVPRNDACPCGSGKKYKKCHGR